MKSKIYIKKNIYYTEEIMYFKIEYNNAKIFVYLFFFFWGGGGVSSSKFQCEHHSC
jgi:hypothetical protein